MSCGEGCGPEGRLSPVRRIIRVIEGVKDTLGRGSKKKRFFFCFGEDIFEAEVSVQTVKESLSPDTCRDCECAGRQIKIGVDC
jgi:hypothetical protein